MQAPLLRGPITVWDLLGGQEGRRGCVRSASCRWFSAAGRCCVMSCEHVRSKAHRCIAIVATILVPRQLGIAVDLPDATHLVPGV
jgi:hypothetical protein